LEAASVRYRRRLKEMHALSTEDLKRLRKALLHAASLKELVWRTDLSLILFSSRLDLGSVDGENPTKPIMPALHPFLMTPAIAFGRPLPARPCGP